MPKGRAAVRNRILARLSADDFARLEPHLTSVPLPVRKQLEGRDRRIEHVYFLESGLASMVVSGGSHDSLEVGMIGREGVTGLAVVMGVDRTPHETFMQSPGDGWRIGASQLRDAMAQSASLQECLLQHGHTLMVQMSYTALSNGRYKVAERLARWLLMAHDRTDGDDVSLTHEFLAVMLGVRRPGVTLALNALERSGMIVATRGRVTIRNRAGLEEEANGGYGAAESEYERLFGDA